MNSIRNRVLIVLFLVICAMTSCGKNLFNVDYEDQEGIIHEKFNTLNKDENRYNNDNKIFKVNTKFIYDYIYLKEDKVLKFEKHEDSWNFINADSITYNIINQISFKVKSGLQPMIKYVPDYNQTIIMYSYPPNESYNVTGIVENKKNVWIHPPRESLFAILELNPFPFIKAPYKVGNNWNWSLKVGSKWGDKRWKVWEGNVEIKYEYNIDENKYVESNFGRIKCYIISSIGKSILGETRLVSYFNKKYGFIKLEYTNIDGSKMIINLKEMKFE